MKKKFLTSKVKKVYNLTCKEQREKKGSFNKLWIKEKTTIVF